MTEHPTLTAALVAALPELTVIEKDQNATITPKSGASFSYSYADIAAIVKVTRPILAEHGIVALTPVHGHEGGLACSVILLHASGEERAFDPFPFPPGVDARATGSMVTYHRRYALVAALGMAVGDGDDDDGASATAAPRKAQTSSVEPPVPGFRSSLIDSMNGLTPAELKLVREWSKQQGLPDSPAKMDAAQADKVCDYILHGLPALEPVS